MTRTPFSISRKAEFFSEKELEMQMGAGREQWLPMLLKELIDNSLDACEGAGGSPEVTVTLEVDAFSVTDNGPGIPPDTMSNSLDYLTRTSSNNLYISPTRGQLGNALKAVYAAGFVVHGSGKVTITARGITHTITVGFDPIRGEPVLTHEQTPAPEAIGTVVKVSWPGAASEMDRQILTTPSWLVWRYEAINPHAAFLLDYGGTIGLFGECPAGGVQQVDARQPSTCALVLPWPVPTAALCLPGQRTADVRQGIPAAVRRDERQRRAEGNPR